MDNGVKGEKSALSFCPPSLLDCLTWQQLGAHRSYNIEYLRNKINGLVSDGRIKRFKLLWPRILLIHH